MSKINYRRRPNCRDIIDGKDKWFLPSLESIDYGYNDLPECQSLNVYIKYHLNSLSSLEQMTQH